MLLVGRQEGHLACKKTEWWDAAVVMCLSRGADLHMFQLMPLPLTVSCSSIQIGFTFLVFPFWCQLTWVVPDKIQEDRKMVVCVLSVFLQQIEIDEMHLGFMKVK